MSEAGDDPQGLRRKYARLFQAHLPQGAPTSPALANLCAWSLDCRLAGLTATFGGRYSRYADDLIFSGDARFMSTLSRFRVGVLAIAHNEGFEIRNRKTLVMKHDQRQTVTGLVVNERANISRRDFDRLKAILTNCKHHGPASQNREQHANFQAHLQRRVAHVASVNPVRGKRLRHLFNAIT
ncbi:reverse transcriptase domain-containing protein [Fuerstiella marisgermanici]|uniref:reverse transcriptase domain-containing protein n=1 Tax=Fuerstiella marisgermanici TaxID=1891926 RepID=UPI001C54FAB3|nr:reverse transcriptase domain-containing protein [Fuerstiella marisgermanici]